MNTYMYNHMITCFLSCTSPLPQPYHPPLNTNRPPTFPIYQPLPPQCTHTHTTPAYCPTQIQPLAIVQGFLLPFILGERDIITHSPSFPEKRDQRLCEGEGPSVHDIARDKALLTTEGHTSSYMYVHVHDKCVSQLI